MSQVGYSTIHVPSRGRFYDGKLPDGKVDIRKMTVREEATLAGQGLTPSERMAAIVAACTKLPEGFAPGDLLLTDRLAILLALRTFTFGSNYTFKFRCPACNAPNQHTIDIVQDLDEKPATEVAVEPIEVNLKDADKRVGLRFLRGKDEQAIIRHAKKLALKSNDAGDPSHTFRMALQIATIDGTPVQSATQAEMFVGGLTMADSVRMRNAIDDAETGIDTEVGVTCRACQTDTPDLALPFDSEFFRPTRL